jgi:hypothetical protein
MSARAFTPKSLRDKECAVTEGRFDNFCFDANMQTGEELLEEHFIHRK